MAGGYDCLHPKELEKIKAACPRVTFEAYIRQNFSNSLAALGELLRVLRVCYRGSAALEFEDSRIEDIREAAKKCSEIEEFELEMVGW